MELQETKKNPKEAKLVHGTIKAAVLEGESKCLDVIVLSFFYDSKDVYFKTTTSTMNHKGEGNLQ